MTYKEYIENRKKRWIGKSVRYGGAIYKVIDVDHNGMLLINKKARFTDTTAVDVLQIEVA